MTEGGSHACMIEAVAAQEEILEDEEGEDQFEELICERPVEAVEACGLQTKSLCMNAGIVNDDEMLQQCHREIALL